MDNNIFKNEDAKSRLEGWYHKFLAKAPAPTTSIEAETSFGKCHVLTAGNPAHPPLICLHAMLTSSAHIMAELSSLTQHFYIIAPDIPGQSVKGLAMRLPYTNDSHARWLGEILDALNINKTHILGVSLGVLLRDNLHQKIRSGLKPYH